MHRLSVPVLVFVAGAALCLAVRSTMEDPGADDERDRSGLRHDDAAPPPTPAPLELSPGPLEHTALVRDADALDGADAPPEPPDSTRRTDITIAEDEIVIDAMATLRGLYANWSSESAWALVHDRRTFRALFRRLTEGPRIDGDVISPRGPLADGTEIRFAAGRHTLDVRLFANAIPPARDVLVRGAGEDDTVVALSDMIDARGEMRSLTFADLTLDTRAQGDLERLRREPYTLRLVRCRVLGFDDGAGGSKMLGGSVGAFYAQDCEFVSGFGSAAGGGKLFDVRGLLLARLERCTISGPIGAVTQSDTRTAVVFDRCVFQNIPARLNGAATSDSATTKFVGCTFNFAPANAPTRLPNPRRLSEISPDWGK